jgi:quinolinate synthase
VKKWKITPGGEPVLILAHNYVRPEVQKEADHVGDSLELAKIAREIRNGTIILAGVGFMAEMAAILSPTSRVIHPEPFSQCAMATRLNPDILEKAREAHQGVPVVTYVNSSAQIKACSDICCTSANAVRVVESLGVPRVLFAPDRNLAGYVARKTGITVIPVPEFGCCPVHHTIMGPEILDRKKRYPDAVVLAHPETTEDVQDLADFVGSTSGMVRFVAGKNFRTVIVGTEPGIIPRMRQVSPKTRFIPASSFSTCPDMKMITLAKIKQAIMNEGPVVTIDPLVAPGARRALERMMEVP